MERWSWIVDIERSRQLMNQLACGVRQEAGSS